jgi:hypothetical protein
VNLRRRNRQQSAPEPVVPEPGTLTWTPTGWRDLGSEAVESQRWAEHLASREAQDRAVREERAAELATREAGDAARDESMRQAMPEHLR